MQILAIDPGVRHLGVALGDTSGRLEWAALIRSPEQTHRGARGVSAIAWELARMLQGRTWGASVVEWPTQYEGVSAFADRKDISLLSAVAGAASVIAASRPLRYELSPEPQGWKGQTPKDIHNARVMSRLTLADRERIVWPAKSLAHNVIDAVGLLLWAGEEIGRLERQAAR